MSPAVVISMMLVAGLLHAGWNLAAKRLGTDRALFLIALSLISFLITLPWALTHLPGADSSGAVAGFVAVRVILNAVYLVTLARAYQRLDLSMAYPMARGSGPLVATVMAITLLEERPALIGVAGVMTVSVAIGSLAGGPGRLPNGDVADRPPAGALVWPLLTGMTIGCYTVLDKAALEVVDPITYVSLVELGTFLLLGSVVAGRGQAAELRSVLARHRGQLLAAAVMVVGSYGLALFALAHTYASYIAPLREVAVLYAVLFGIVVLREPRARRRIPAAAGIVAGLVMVGGAM